MPSIPCTRVQGRGSRDPKDLLSLPYPGANHSARRLTRLAVIVASTLVGSLGFVPNQGRATADTSPATQPAPSSPSPSVPSDQEAATLSGVNVTASTGQALPMTLASAPAVVESLTASQIRETVNLMTTAQALKYLPSIEVRERYIGDRNAVVATRTTGTVSSAESLVYADDLLLSNLLGNSYGFPPRWGLVPPNEIERVDVMYGPFSALYPGNSLGGVITLETRMPTRAEFHVALNSAVEDFRLYGTHERNGNGNLSIAGGNRWGPVALWMSYDHLDSEGQPMSFSTAALSNKPAGAGATPVTGAIQDIDQNGKPRLVFGGYAIDHSLQDQGKLKLSWDFSEQLHALYTFGLWHNDSQTTASTCLTDMSTGRPFYNGAANIDGRAYAVAGLSPGSAEQSHMLNALSLFGDTRGAFDWRISYSSYQYLSDHTRSASSTNNSLSGSDQVQDGTGWQTGDLRMIWRLSPLLGPTHQLSFGYHIDDFLLKQRTYATADWRYGPNGNLSSASGGETQTQAIYLQDVVPLGTRWTLTLGGREEYWQAFDGFNRVTGTLPSLANYPDQHRRDFSPKAAVSWDITSSLQTRLSYGRAMRYPTVTELYQQVTSGNQLVQNNPHLQPEDARSFDWTTQYSWDSGIVRLSLFQENRHNALFSQVDTTVSPNLTQIENIDRAHIRGAESAFEVDDVGVEGLNVTGSLTYAESAVQADRRAPAAVGKEFPRIPRWRNRLSLTYHPNDNLTYALGYRYSSGAYSTLLNTDINHDTYGGISRYSVVDAKVTYRVAPRLTASIGVDNLGNEKYFVSPHPYPQRTTFLGLNYDY